MADLVPDYWKHYFSGPAHVQLPPKADTPNAQTGPPTKDDTARKVRLSGGVMAGKLIKDVTPKYPYVARSYHRQGRVILQATISKDGSITDLSIVQPAGMGLDEAAIEAVKQWKYKPYLLQGEPVEVETTITVNFTLGG